MPVLDLVIYVVNRGSRLAFPCRKSYGIYVVKNKQKSKEDNNNVVDFVPSSESTSAENELEKADSPEGLEDLSPEESSEESLESAESRIELLQQEKDKYYDLMLRRQAELENYRKRVAREKSEAVNLAKSVVLQGVLPIVDACEKGIENLSNEEGDDVLESYIEGYQLLLKQLKAFLQQNNVSQVAGVGSIFDPNVHEAVLREVSSEHEDGEILEEYRRGYTMNEQLLRAAQVKVAVHPD